MGNNVTIVADNKIPFLKGALEPYATISYLPAKEITNANIKDADALIIRTRTFCNAELLRDTKVRFIATATIGFDHIDDAYCKERGIRWVSAPGCNSSSVMQYLGSALATLAKEQGKELAGRTLGVVGVGNVGKKIARLASMFGMNVLCNDPPRMRTEQNLNFVSLEQIQQQADIITFHVPMIKEGVDKTLHMANGAFFEHVQNGVTIINTSRGGVVETSALKYALRLGKVSSAVLDVWEHEPLLDSELLQMVTIATPHIAGYSADGKANGTAICVHAVSEFFGLGVPVDWFPVVPLPEDGATLRIECSGKSLQEVVYEACTGTYAIRSDDERLRHSPETFEQQRNEYPVRREYDNYTLKLLHPTDKMKEALGNLGFLIHEQ